MTRDSSRFRALSGFWAAISTCSPLRSRSATSHSALRSRFTIFRHARSPSRSRLLDFRPAPFRSDFRSAHVLCTDVRIVSWTDQRRGANHHTIAARREAGMKSVLRESVGLRALMQTRYARQIWTSLHRPSARPSVARHDTSSADLRRSERWYVT